MRLPKLLRSLSAWHWAALALIVVVVALQFLPLTRELHYELSASMALVTSMAVGLAALASWWRADRDGDVATTPAPIASALGWSVVVTIPPLVVSLAHNIATGACSAVDGLLWYVVLVPPSAVLAVAVARLGRALTRRRSSQVVVFMVLWGSSLMRGAIEALVGPHIFLYTWQAGFFPGGSWDPELPITPLLLLYRAGHLAIASILLLVLAEIEAIRAGRPVRGAALVLPSTVAAAIVLALLPLRADMGLTRTDSWLRCELGDSLHTRYATIYYHGPSTDSLDIWRAANYVDFYIARHASVLGLKPYQIEPVTVYAYASSAEQRRLVGTSSASFTKPWRRTLNLSFDRVAPALEHELAHIMLEPYGNILGISWSNGLLEGSAVALEHGDDAELLHRHARAAYDFGLAPPVTRIMSSTGFASYRASLSYVIAGSFCRWLIDTYGIERFRDAYASGSLDAHYGRSEEDLAAEYQRHLATLPETSPSLEPTVRYLYGGGSFFLQRCLRRLATLTASGWRALGEERYDEARARFEESLAEGITSAARAGIIRSLHGAGRFGEVIDSTTEYLRDTASWWMLPYRIEASDAYAMLGDGAQQRSALLEVVRYGADDWTRLRAALRLLLASDDSSSIAWDSTSGDMRRYFSTPMSPLARFAMLSDVRRRVDRARPGWHRRDDLLRLMQAGLVAKQNPVLAVGLADGVEQRDEPARAMAAPSPMVVTEPASEIDETALHAFARAALHRSLLDARILSEALTSGGRIRRAAHLLLVQSYPSVREFDDTGGTLVGAERPRREAREFIAYLARYGTIRPWRR